MKTQLLLLGALLTPALACDRQTFRVSFSASRPATVASVGATAKPTKQPAPSAPAAPAPKPTGKSRESRPAPPAHLFM